jgi:hypothetical protein
MDVCKFISRRLLQYHSLQIQSNYVISKPTGTILLTGRIITEKGLECTLMVWFG